MDRDPKTERDYAAIRREIIYRWWHYNQLFPPKGEQQTISVRSVVDYLQSTDILDEDMAGNFSKAHTAWREGELRWSDMFAGIDGDNTQRGQARRYWVTDPTLAPLEPWMVRRSPNLSRRYPDHDAEPVDSPADDEAPDTDQDSPGFGVAYRREDPTVVPATPSGPPTYDPDSFGAGLGVHRDLQNRLADWVRDELRREPRSRDPNSREPRFDLAWSGTARSVVVVEVKTLLGDPVGQLRRGLGQVLDYADRMIEFGWEVAPVVCVDRPVEERWERIYERAGVLLVWEQRWPRLRETSRYARDQSRSEARAVG